MAASAGPVRADSHSDPEGAPQAGAPSQLAATKRILEMIAAGASLTNGGQISQITRPPGRASLMA